MALGSTGSTQSSISSSGPASVRPHAAQLEKLEKLRTDQRRIELERFLHAFEIEKATITGIGTGRKQTLESLDRHRHLPRMYPVRITAVAGFGPVLTGNLMTWRQSLEARFKFDPAKAIDPKDVTNVEREVLVERLRLENGLRKGAEELRQLQIQIMAARQL